MFRHTVEGVRNLHWLTRVSLWQNGPGLWNGRKIESWMLMFREKNLTSFIFIFSWWSREPPGSFQHATRGSVWIMGHFGNTRAIPGYSDAEHLWWIKPGFCRWVIDSRDISVILLMAVEIWGKSPGACQNGRLVGPISARNTTSLANLTDFFLELIMSWYQHCNKLLPGSVVKQPICIYIYTIECHCWVFWTSTIFYCCCGCCSGLFFWHARA